MAIAVTNAASGSGVFISSIATASRTPANEQLVALLVEEPDTTTITCTGNSITYTERERFGFTEDGVDCTLVIWTASSSGATAGATTIDWGTSSRAAYFIDEVSGAETGASFFAQGPDTENEGSSTSLSVTLTNSITSGNAIYMVCASDAFATWTVGTDFSSDSGSVGSNRPTLMGEYDLTPADATADATQSASFAAAVGCCFEIAAASSGNTLTANSGSYAVTGTDADLNAGRELIGNSGSYALTGTSADLNRGYTLECQAGSYSVSGTDADLNISRELIANSGTYVLSGTNAGLNFGALLNSNSGTYVLTGTDADLNYGSLGSYTLEAESGSYAITGTNADLKASRALVSQSGTFSYTGNDADLNLGVTLEANSGSFAVTGTDVDLKKASLLTANSGTYNLTGSNVSLTYSGQALWEVQSKDSTSWAEQSNDLSTWTIQ